MSKTVPKRDPQDYRPSIAKETGTPVADPRRGTDGIGPDSLFKEAVQRDPSLCNNCFSERFDYELIEWHCGDQGWLNWSRRFAIPGRNSPDPNRGLRQDGGPLCCANCGHHTGKDRELSHREAAAHGARISEALSKRGIEHDRRTLLAVIEDRVASGEHTGVEDAGVFPQAVSEAVRACQ